MKTFSNWLNEDRDPADKSEGHRKATLLADYIDDNDLLAALMGQPSKSVVYRFLAIVQSLPAHEKAEFERKMQELQANALMAQQGNAKEQQEQ